MKTLITCIVLFLTLSISAQQDEAELTKEVISYYNDIIDSTPDLEVTKAGIKKAEKLRAMKENKVKVSYVLAVMYTIYATEYTKEDTGTTGFKHKGTATAEEIKTARSKAIEYYQYYIDNAKVKDDTYREAQSQILRL